MEVHLTLNTTDPQDRSILAAILDGFGGDKKKPQIRQIEDPYAGRAESAKPKTEEAKPAPKKGGRKAKPQPEPTVEVEPEELDISPVPEPEPEAPAATMEEVRQRFTKFITEHGTEPATKILKMFNADRASSLKPEQLTPFLAQLIDYTG